MGSGFGDNGHARTQQGTRSPASPAAAVGESWAGQLSAAVCCSSPGLHAAWAVGTGGYILFIIFSPPSVRLWTVLLEVSTHCL